MKLIHIPSDTLENSPKIDQNPAALYLSQLAPGSRRTMQQSLNAIARLFDPDLGAFTFPWHQMRYQHVSAVRSRLAEQYSPATVNKMLVAMKRCLKESMRLGQMTAEDYTRAVDVKPIKSSGLLKGRALSKQEVSALFSNCTNDSSILGLRDAAMLSVLRVGLRRSEVVKLELADFNSTTGGLIIRGGKGGKDRVVYLPSTAIAFVSLWVQVRGNTLGPLLYPVNSSGKIIERRMSDQTVLTILRKRGSQSGVLNFSPHDFRRTFISDLLDAGVDISTVQKLAGHADPATSARYDRRGEEVKRKAVDVLGF